MELEIQTSENLAHYVDKIKKKIDSIATGFFDIGYYLFEIKHFNYYLESGYKDVYEFAEKELNFKKVSTHNFISIVDKYAERESFGAYPKMWISKKYQSFGYSQLTEMLSLSPDKREQIKSDMTIKEIRELKKVIDPKEECNNIIDVAFENDTKLLKDNKISIIPDVNEIHNLKSIIDNYKMQLEQTLDISRTKDKEYEKLKSTCWEYEKRDLIKEIKGDSSKVIDIKSDAFKYLNERIVLVKSLSKEISIKKNKSDYDTKMFLRYEGSLNELDLLIDMVNKDFVEEVFFE
jgi:hypothetical protein